MSKSKTQKALYNSVATALQLLVSQVISLVVSRRVLQTYGSDINGVNAILSNLMEWILLLEGGLTTASNVALFKPFVNKDYDQCNRILSATKKRFAVIGVLVLVCGIGVAVVYPPFIKTDIALLDVFLMFTLMTMSTSFSVAFTRKYALLFNVSQHEFINTLITVLVSVAGNIGVFVLAVCNAEYLYIRLAYLLTTVLTGLITMIAVKKMYPFVNYNVEPDYKSIKGTTDVVFQKLTGIVRSSAPLMFISMFISSTFASVYSVYIFIYGFIRKLVMMVVTSTQGGIGQLIAEKSTEEVYKVFRIFEYASILCASWLMAVAIPMTMPFVRFYTKSITDAQYVDYLLLFFIASNIFIQVLHVPSGTVINMSGKFREDRNFQLVSISVMVVGAIGLNIIWPTYGMLLGIMLASLVLAVQEIFYTRSRIFKTSYQDFFKPLFTNAVILVPAVYVQMLILPEQFTILTFALWGVILAAWNGLCVVIANYFLERERLMSLVKRFRSVFGKG